MLVKLSDSSFPAPALDEPLSVTVSRRLTTLTELYRLLDARTPGTSPAALPRVSTDCSPAGPLFRVSVQVTTGAKTRAYLSDEVPSPGDALPVIARLLEGLAVSAACELARAVGGRDPSATPKP